MFRRHKDVLRGTFLNDAAGVHHGDAIGDFGHHPEVVSYEQDSELHFAAKPVEKFEDLFLYRDIKSCGWLIGDEQFRIGGQGHGDHDALAETAGELMRELPGADLGLGNGGAFESGDDAVAQVGFPEAWLVSANGFFDLCANTHDGIQRGHRLLKDHGDLLTADSAPIVFFVQICQILWRGFTARKQRLTVNTRTGREQAHQRERKHGLAAAGFTDKTKRFSGSNAQGDVIHRAHPTGSGGQFHRNATKFERRAHVSIIFGSTLSNRKMCSRRALEVGWWMAPEAGQE
jgi:hypothetical protein